MLHKLLKKEIFIASIILFLIFSVSTNSVAYADPKGDAEKVKTSKDKIIGHYKLVKSATGTDTIIIWIPDPNDPKKIKFGGTATRPDPNPAVLNEDDTNLDIRTEEWTPTEQTIWDKELKKAYPGIVITNAATKSYNCHSFTFDKSNQVLAITQNDLTTILSDQKYTKVTGKAMVGDIIVYRTTPNGDITHSGKVTKVNAAGMVTEVQSKWGPGPEFKHTPGNVPPAYGKNTMILRSSLANPEIGNPVVPENNNLFEIEEAIKIDTDALQINEIEVDPDIFDAALPPCNGELDLDHVADLITFEFDMRVDEIAGDDEGLLDGILDVNDMIHGTYSFAPDALDLDPSSEFGLFDVDAFSIHLDSVVYENTPPFLEACDAIFVVNDFFGLDEYFAEACNLEQQSGPVVAEFGLFFLGLDDSSQTALSDDSLPLVPPDLDDFDDNFASLFLSDFDLGENGNEVSPQQLRSQIEPLQGVFIQINGVITSLETQPTPPPPQPPIVGGEFLLTDSTALLLVGAQSFSWMIPVVLSIAGIGLFVVSRKSA